MMKKAPLPTSPAAYVASLAGWQLAFVQALRAVVLEAAPRLQETVKWGHLVYRASGPVLLIRAEERRVLFGFWRGKRLLHIEPRLRGGGKYELRTLELASATPLARETALSLVRQAAALDASLGDPTRLS